MLIQADRTEYYTPDKNDLYIHVSATHNNQSLPINAPTALFLSKVSDWRIPSKPPSHQTHKNFSSAKGHGAQRKAAKVNASEAGLR